MSKKKLSLQELKAEQLRITAAIAAAERAEREAIGIWIQTVTGLDTLAEIKKIYNLIEKNGGQKND